MEINGSNLWVDLKINISEHLLFAESDLSGGTIFDR